MRNKPLFTASAACVIAAGLGSPAHATDWLQFGYDQIHSGNNTAEPGYSTSTGNRLAFSAVTLVHQADSAPIFVSGITTPTGVHDILFVNALDGTLMALNAANGATLWSHQPTPAAGTNGTIAAGGTTSSPAVDPARQHVFAFGLDGNVHKYQVGDGTEELAGGTVIGKLVGWPQISTLKPGSEKGAAGIAIAPVTVNNVVTNYLYSATNGYDGDGGDYQGHLTTINLSTDTQNVFNVECSDQTIHFTTTMATDCSSRQNGIWGRPGAVYDADTGRVYVATANGPFNANSPGGHNWGDSVLALNPDGTGSSVVPSAPVDSYTPASYQGLQNTDADLGSTSPAILPVADTRKHAHLALQAAKDACVRLIDLDDMSGQGGPAHVGGELQQSPFFTAASNNCTSGDDAQLNGGHSSDEIKPQTAVWVNPSDGSTWAYVVNGRGIAGYQLTFDGVGNPSLTSKWTVSAGGTSPVIANNVLYYVTSNKVLAVNPTSGTTIWSDTQIGSIHWQSLILVNSRLYVIDSTSKLWVYQLDGVFKGGFD
jgi:hypothetical protein